MRIRPATATERSHVFVFRIGLEVSVDLFDGVMRVGLVEVVVGAGFVDSGDTVVEGVFGTVGVRVAAHVVAEVEGGHVEVPVLEIRVGKEEEDGVGAGSAQRERVKFLEQACCGEPLAVVVVFQGAGVVHVERFECDPLVAHAADRLLFGRFGTAFLRLRHGLDRVCLSLRVRHNSVNSATKVRCTHINREG